MDAEAGDYDSSLLPSEHENRVEGLNLHTETKTDVVSSFFPIQRHPDGKFSDFGDARIFHTKKDNPKVQRSGRFSDLLPDADIPEPLQKAALALLNRNLIQI